MNKTYIALGAVALVAVAAFSWNTYVDQQAEKHAAELLNSTDLADTLKYKKVTGAIPSPCMKPRSAQVMPTSPPNPFVLQDAGLTRVALWKASPSRSKALMRPRSSARRTAH